MSHHKDIHAAKQALRAAIKTRRAAIPAESRLVAAQAIAAETVALLHVQKLAGREAQVVSGFQSIGDEVDTGPVLKRLHAAKYTLCLPVMQGKNQPLLFRQWAPGDAMNTKVWGIQEPEADQPSLIPDVMLVPLLAVDPTGMRLGYGGGFYDRTIQVFRQLRGVLTVGIAFDEQRVDAVPHLAYDMALDWIVTPSGVHRGQPNNSWNRPDGT